MDFFYLRCFALLNLVAKSENHGQWCAELMGDVGEEVLLGGLHLLQGLHFAASVAQHVPHEGDDDQGQQHQGDEHGVDQPFGGLSYLVVLAQDVELVFLPVALHADAHVLYMVDFRDVQQAVLQLLRQFEVVESLPVVALAGIHLVILLVNFGQMLPRVDDFGHAIRLVQIGLGGCQVALSDVEAGQFDARFQPVPLVAGFLHDVQ